jgi:hypothetical protein
MRIGKRLLAASQALPPSHFVVIPNEVRDLGSWLGRGTRFLVASLLGMTRRMVCGQPHEPALPVYTFEPYP